MSLALCQLKFFFCKILNGTLFKKRDINNCNIFSFRGQSTPMVPVNFHKGEWGKKQK